MAERHIKQQKSLAYAQIFQDHFEPKHDNDDQDGSITLPESKECKTIEDITQHPPVEAAADNPHLDPSSPNFDETRWMQNLVTELNKAGITPTQTTLAFRDLSVSGPNISYIVQPNLWTTLQAPVHFCRKLMSPKSDQPTKTILDRVDGLVESGELLLVLGRPGAGCSTLLKSMVGELSGLHVEEDARNNIMYNGLPQDKIVEEFRGEAIYSPEDVPHYAHLTVGQTLSFAAACRTPSTRPNGVTRKEHIRIITQAAMAVCGIGHVVDAKVGNDLVPGISPGERKRLAIAEIMVSGASVVAWDQSTKGLDSNRAAAFIKSLRLVARLAGVTQMVSMFAVPEQLYHMFDKVTVLYEGRQIFFGSTNVAKEYFLKMGFECPPGQSTADFLTSVTNPPERRPNVGRSPQIPRTAENFQTHWRQSEEYRDLKNSINGHRQKFASRPSGGQSVLASRKSQVQANHSRRRSPFIITLPMQIKATTIRAFQRIWGDKTAIVTHVALQTLLALILGSAFYSTPDTAEAFFSKGSILFICALRSVVITLSEVEALYEQRAIMEKHFIYAYHHPIAEAIAGYIADFPVRFLAAILFNIIVYFLSGLRRESGAFFLFFFTTFILSVVMSAMFRSIAANTRNPGQAMIMISVLLIGFIMYSGYQVREPQMHAWFSWIRWLSPVFYAFEILITNEVNGLQLRCSIIVPPFEPTGDSWICSTIGAVAGELFVSGDTHIEQSFGYRWDNVPRNCGILIAYLAFFMGLYSVSIEIHASKARTISFPSMPVLLHVPKQPFVEDTAEYASVETELSLCMTLGEVLSWRNLRCEVPGHERNTTVLTDRLSGCVAPGSLTALMGASGAGKTVLLEILAQRKTGCKISGETFLGKDSSSVKSHRKIGYGQQHDLHLHTATVREALQFSALLRQPKSTPVTDKLAFVEDLMNFLGLREYADHVVGQPGRGLDLTRRKIVGIGVELAAKPKVLLLDGPATGLDSHSALSLYQLLRRLADRGQAILCTASQPSAVMFELFDRVLCLGPGGKSLYFGNTGPKGMEMIDYFESHGGRKCGSEENPADYMLDVTSDSATWSQKWIESDQNRRMMLDVVEMSKPQSTNRGSDNDTTPSYGPQFILVLGRLFKHYMRNPAYVIGKLAPTLLSGLFIGFSYYDADASFAGMQNVMFAVFMVLTLFVSQASQLQPNFVALRALFEKREGPTGAYSWQVFLLSCMTIELPFQIINGVSVYGCFYYAVTGIQSSDRQGLVLLFCVQLFVYAASFGFMVIAALPDPETASSVVLLLMFMMLTFCGVLQPVPAMPGFWRFMYRLSPFTYWLSGMVSTQLHQREVACSIPETSIFDPPRGMSCGEYLGEDITPLVLQNPNDSYGCRICSLGVADEFLAGSGISWNQRWRNFGVVWAFIVFNFTMAFVSYWMFRTRHLHRKLRRLR